MIADRPQGTESEPFGVDTATARLWRPVPWSLKDILRASLAALALLAAGVLLVVVVAVVAGFAGFDLTDAAFLQFTVFAVMALESVFVLPAWWWGPRKHALGLDWLGLRPTKALRAVNLIVVGFALIMGINLLWSVVMVKFDLPGQADLVPLFGEGPWGLAGAIIVACVIAPFAEETFFRGFMYAGMRDRWGLAAGVIASALIFALFHMSLSTLVPIAAMGAVFALLYERTDALWPCIALHAAVNLLGVLGAYAA
jgi:membrane protease YdiL (CAAX protease family)